MIYFFILFLFLLVIKFSISILHKRIVRIEKENTFEIPEDLTKLEKAILIGKQLEQMR